MKSSADPSPESSGDADQRPGDPPSSGGARRARRRTSNPTIRDVARRAGVSVATVSRALNTGIGVRAPTLTRVLAAARELGYTPDAAARSLSSGVTRTIGFLFVNRALAADPERAEEHEQGLYHSDIIRGALRAALRADHKVLVGYSNPRRPDDSAVELFASADALVVVDAAASPTCVASLSQRKPVITVGWSVACGAATRLCVDNTGGITDLVRHLARRHGHASIGFVSGPPTSADAAERRSALVAVAAIEGATVTDLGEGDYTASSGAAALERWWTSTRTPPPAIVCANDQMAAGVLAVLQRRGWAVPGRCAVIGFDDAVIAAYFQPPLTTIRQPAEDLGKIALEESVARLNGHLATGRPILLPTTLVVRASCGCPA